MNVHGNSLENIKSDVVSKPAVLAHIVLQPLSVRFQEERSDIRCSLNLVEKGVEVLQASISDDAVATAGRSCGVGGRTTLLHGRNSSVNGQDSGRGCLQGSVFMHRLFLGG